MTSYYDILGIARDATDAEIRDQFRILARDAHPDRHRDAEEKKIAEVQFQLLTEAVNVLTNPARRKAHDFELDKHVPAAVDAQAIGRTYLARGVKAYKDGNFPQAVTEFNMSVRHYEKDAKAWHYLALSCLKVVGQVRRGVEAIEAALRIDGNNALFRKDAGKLYLLAGLNSKAERHLVEALKWLPEDSETLTLLQRARGGSEEKRRPTSGNFGRKG